MMPTCTDKSLNQLKLTAESEPSQRSEAMQPCSSLLTMDFVQSSTARRSFFDRLSGSRDMVRSSSLLRMASALARSACIR
jgi:hypothetical protein